MNIEELKAKLYQTDESGEKFEEYVRSGYKQEEVNGIELETVIHERENESMICVFKADGRFYSTTGSYDSWSDTEWYNIRGFWEVEPTEVKTIQYLPVK